MTEDAERGATVLHMKDTVSKGVTQATWEKPADVFDGVAEYGKLSYDINDASFVTDDDTETVLFIILISRSSPERIYYKWNERLESISKIWKEIGVYKRKVVECFLVPLRLIAARGTI